MKGLSVSSGILGMVSLERSIDILVELGYQGIDVNTEPAPAFLPIPKPHMTPYAPSSTRKRIRKYAEHAGLDIVTVNAHNNLTDSRPEVRQESLQFNKAAIELASDLGAPYVINHGGVKNFYGRESQFFEWLVDALRELVSDAERLGVTLGMECGSFPGLLITNLKKMQKLLSYDGLETLGVLFDPAHYQLRGDSVIEAYQTLKDRIVHVHAKDAWGDPEEFEFPPLGQGEVDFDGLLGAMVADSYPGYISVEYEAFAWGYSHDPRKILKESKEFIDNILAKHT